MATSIMQLPRPVASGPHSELIRWDEWGKVGSPQWLIPGLIPRKALVVLFGPSGSYKSWLALDLGLALSKGQPFLGFEQWSIQDRRRTLYVAGEDSPPLIKARLDTLALRRGVVTWPGLTVLANRLNLADEKDREKVAELARGEDLVILDTLAALWSQSERDASALIAWTDTLRQAGSTVLIIHHTRKPSVSKAIDNSDPDNIMGTSRLRRDPDVLLSATAVTSSDAMARYIPGVRFRMVKNRFLEATAWPDLEFLVDVAGSASMFSRQEPEPPAATLGPSLVQQGMIGHLGKIVLITVAVVVASMVFAVLVALFG